MIRHERHVGGLFVPLFTDIGARPSSGGSTHPNVQWVEMMALVIRPSSSGGNVHPVRTGLQAVKLSPYDAGLAEPDTHGLCAVSVFLKCCFPLRLSAPGYSDDPKNSLLFLAPCGSDITARDTAHHLTLDTLEPCDLPFHLS